MKRRKRSTPLMLFWSKTEQRRFVDAVERLVSTVNDLAVMLQQERDERSARARKAAATRRAASDAPPAAPTLTAGGEVLANGEGGGQ